MTGGNRIIVITCSHTSHQLVCILPLSTGVPYGAQFLRCIIIHGFPQTSDIKSCFCLMLHTYRQKLCVICYMAFCLTLILGYIYKHTSSHAGYGNITTLPHMLATVISESPSTLPHMLAMVICASQAHFLTCWP